MAMLPFKLFRKNSFTFSLIMFNSPVFSATTLASLSNDLEICKQMFSYGAIKPLINVSDGKVTTDACMLAGLGCITQMVR